MKEGDEVVERIRKEKPIFNEIPHDALRNADILFDAFDNRLRIVYIARDPIEIIHDWYVRGFGTRIGTDPLEFRLSYEWKNDFVSVYAVNWEDEYLSLGPIERNIGMISYHLKGNIDSYHNLPPERKDRVMFVLFDELVSNPMPVCVKIAKFLGTEVTPQTKKTLKREKCPRIVSSEDKLKKKRVLEEGASEKYRGTLEQVIREHEKIVKSHSILASES